MRGSGRRGRAALFAVALVAAPASAVLLTATAAGAVTVTVDNTGDPAVGNPANCPAVPAGTCTLRDAIAAANAGAADTVSITVGPISLTQGALAHPAVTALSIEGNGNSVAQTTAAKRARSSSVTTAETGVADGRSGGPTRSCRPCSVTCASMRSSSRPCLRSAALSRLGSDPENWARPRATPTKRPVSATPPTVSAARSNERRCGVPASCSDGSRRALPRSGTSS